MLNGCQNFMNTQDWSEFHLSQLLLYLAVYFIFLSLSGFLESQIKIFIYKHVSDKRPK